MKDNRKVLYGLVALALLLSVVGISIGFASLSQELVITGRAEVVPANWEIVFKNLSAADTSGGGVQVSAPSIGADSTTISGVNVRFAKPGDTISYTFDVYNDGDIDAKFSTLTFGTPTITATATDPDDNASDVSIVTNALKYEITHTDGTALSTTDELDAHDHTTLKLTIYYDQNAEDIPTDTVNITNFEATLLYVQK